MKLFNKTNPDHIRILREELGKVLKEQDFTAPGEGEQLAKNDQGGRTNLRAIKSKKFNNVIKDYLDIVNKDTVDNLSVEQSYDLLTKLNNLETNLKAIKSKLDMDSLDPYNPNPFNRLVIKYLDDNGKDILDDITVEQSYDLLTKLQKLQSKIPNKDAMKPSRDINPYDMPGGDSTGYMGSTYRGD